MAETLMVNEIYLSLQGESTFAGLPCVFVRLTACNLRCSYCDTAYAFAEGSRKSLEEILEEVQHLSTRYAKNFIPRLPLVELTGGEPLLQKNAIPLMRELCESGYTVLLETSGAHDISPVDQRVHRIVDVKCPSSGEADKNRWENLDLLTSRDEVKFVLGTWEDLAFAEDILERHQLSLKGPVLFSWVHPLEDQQRHPSLKTPPPGRPITRLELAEEIVARALPVRFQLQMHKIIWTPETRGV